MKQIRQIASLSAVMLLSLGVLLSPISAQATLIGDSVHATFLFPDFATVDADGGIKTIAAGTVFDFTSTEGITITFSASQITITNVTGFGNFSASFNGPDLAFLSGPTITNVTEDPASSSAFATGSVLSFSSNDINVNIAGTCPCLAGSEIILDVTTAPEPPTVAILVAGLLGLGFLTRWTGRRALS